MIKIYKLARELDSAICNIAGFRSEGTLYYTHRMDGSA